MADISKEDRKSYIAALLRERAGYVTRGESERAQLVDAELRRLGYEAKAPAKRAERRPAGVQPAIR